jgi:cytochrome c556
MGGRFKKLVVRRERPPAIPENRLRDHRPENFSCQPREAINTLVLRGSNSPLTGSRIKGSIPSAIHQKEIQMPPSRRNTLLAIITLSGLALSPLAISHFDDKQVPQSYRQSYYAMMGANFGPMIGMVKGEIPWQEDQMAAYADQLAALATLDVMRGFVDGSDKGTTRAKPEIWQNTPDFQAKMDDLKKAANALQAVANQGTDRKAIAAEVVATGKACKACHDEYKAEDYLY